MRASGRAAVIRRFSQGNTFSSHQRATSGKDSRRSVSPVGAQSTMITSNSPDSWWRLSCSREKISSIPGGTVSSSARMRSTPRSDSSPPSHRCTAFQWRSSSASACTSWPQRLSATGVGRAPELRLERVGQAVRGIGRQDHRAKAAARDLRARSPRPRSSCRLPPCPCRGSCGASSVADSTPNSALRRVSAALDTSSGVACASAPSSRGPRPSRRTCSPPGRGRTACRCRCARRRRAAAPSGCSARRAEEAARGQIRLAAVAHDDPDAADLRQLEAEPDAPARAVAGEGTARCGSTRRVLLQVLREVVGRGAVGGVARPLAEVAREVAVERVVVEVRLGAGIPGGPRVERPGARCRSSRSAPSRRRRRPGSGRPPRCPLGRTPRRCAGRSPPAGARSARTGAGAKL